MTMTETRRAGLETVAVPVGTTAVIFATGAVDVGTARQLRGQLARSGRHFQTIVLDLSGVTFLDAAGLGVIAMTLKHSHSVAGFRLRNPSEPARRLLESSGFDRFIPIETSSPHSVGHCGAEPTPSVA